MATASPAFLRVWRHDGLRAVLLSHMDTESICALRLTASECCELTTPTLFTRTRLTFTPSALSRPSRLEALARIGHHIEHLTFSMPHTSSTFLPPLINPESGREVNFLYTPHKSTASVSQRPKYGCSELGDILTQQYPPLFHAATNVPAFINALSQLPNLRHLTVACPGQDPAQRYRRDCVDYALISLRIAIERAPLLKLEKLSLSHLHPSALLYLRHMPGFGCTPSAGRRWKQIRKLNITMDSWDFLGQQPGRDHLKILDDYIRSFSSTLEKVSFGWNGRKGPCPFTLFSDPLFAPPRKAAKLFAEVTSPMSPLPAAPLRPSMVFPNLRYMQVRNATMSSEQVSDFILNHRHTVREFDFENVNLINNGTWEDALLPLTGSTESEEWLSQQSGSEVESSSSYNNLSDLDQIDELEEQSEVIDTALDPNASFEGLPPKELTDPPTQPKHKRVRKKRRRRKTSHMHPPPPEETPSFKTTASGSKIVISAPIPITAPIEEVLMPTTFSPSHHNPSRPQLDRNPSSSSTFITNPNIQGVQRNMVQEAGWKELADDPEKRVSTLKKAKEAVLRQLGKEFSCKEKKSGLFKHGCGSNVGRGKSRAFLGHGVEGSTTALVPLMFSRY